MAVPPTISILPIPHSPPSSNPDDQAWPTLLHKLKCLRLHALSDTPAAFSSTHARESAFSDSVWEERLRNPEATTFVAIQTAPSYADASSPQNKIDELRQDERGIELLVRGEWIGTITLLGPDLVNVNDDAGCFEYKQYDINALYVKPAFRRMGVGRSLLDAAVRLTPLLDEAPGSGKVRFVVRVLDSNEGVRGWYEKSGFQAVELAGKVEVKGQKAVVMERWV